MRIIVLSIIALLLAGGFVYVKFVHDKNIKTVSLSSESNVSPTAATKTSATSETESAVAVEAKGITVSVPKSGQKIKSPAQISGTAVGSWYFEGEIPSVLYDSKGEEIVRGNAKAQGEWMTDQPVPFELILEFDQPVTSTGKLVLIQNNPSGQGVQNQSIEIPVKFY